MDLRPVNHTNQYPEKPDNTDDNTTASLRRLTAAIERDLVDSVTPTKDITPTFLLSSTRGPTTTISNNLTWTNPVNIITNATALGRLANDKTTHLFTAATTTATPTTAANTTAIMSGSHHTAASTAMPINGSQHMGTIGANQTHPDLGWSDYVVPKMNNLSDVFALGCSTALVFGGLVPYIPQYLKIKESGSSDGFSTYVCLTLLLANILRIAFWFGHRFELPLLIQSFVMIAGMMALMEICVRVRSRSSAYVIPSAMRAAASSGASSRSTTTARSLFGLNSHYFWDWDDLFSYVVFLSYFTLALSLLTYLLLDNHLYIETLGYVALFTEAILGMPQLTRNFQKKSTLGMSVHMVIMWLSGDLFKTLYYILRKLPAQFVVCGSIQVIVDILILSQVIWYKRPKVTYRKLPKTT